MNIEIPSSHLTGSYPGDQKRLLFVSILKMCIFYACVHFVLWVMAMEFSSFRPTFYASLHSFTALVLSLLGIVPSDHLFAFGLFILPLVSAVLNIFVIAVGGFVGGRIAFHRNRLISRRDVYWGGGGAFLLIILINLIAEVCFF
ncbi:hypothetical protein Pla110_04560 [Polystyrenella longa]|uniref:Uncharacterized protein n=1 Tax=Polystyrenella longa TaxID=2528007 RepID=A0A518CHQ4_9PLAN|nr:hypothetical protein [Polystyrenella longa]QDU78752.1 hypothetical protein Pla110_04560 [Polystyrenella longa]